jgi:phenylacetate-coenzyme A ligase PaaK-like adenylate-forming protein
VAEQAGSNGEYICVVEPPSASGRDEMTVLVEAADLSVEHSGLEQALSRRLHEALGVKLDVKVVGNGELSRLTGISELMKVRRLLDKRKS